MKSNSNKAAGEPSNVPLIPPMAAVLSLGMILPEYWLIVVACSLVTLVPLAIIQRVSGRADWRNASQTADLP